eukprot:25796_1
MGNQSNKEQSSNSCISLSNKHKYKCSKKDNDPSKFIINLNRKQKLQNINNNHLISDQRRVVFISLIGLYYTWQITPTPILYSSIFLLALKKKWIYNPIKYEKEIQQTVLCATNIFKDKVLFGEFINLLKWKDTQGLLFFMFDEYEPNDSNDTDDAKSDLINQLVSPLWANFSRRLTTLYDPITKSKYKPIKCNAKWWEYSYNKLFKSHYKVRTSTILSELYFVTLKFKPMQEILYQSNPGSLNPIISYDLNPECDNM